MGMLLAGQHHRGLSHIRLVPQCYSASMQLCLIQTDVYSQFATAVFHIWSLFAGQGHFLWLDSLFCLKICFTSCRSCPSHCKKMFGGKLTHKP